MRLLASPRQIDIGTLVIHRPSAIPGRPWPDVRHRLGMDMTRTIGRHDGYASAQDAFDAAYYLTFAPQAAAVAIFASGNGRFLAHPLVLDGRMSLGLSQLVRAHSAQNVELFLTDPRVLAVVDGANWVTRPTA